MLRLQVIPRDAAAFETVLEEEEVVVGRSREASLVVADRFLSRKHARLFLEEGRWMIEDLGSHNGTRLNGELVEKATPVGRGDRVELSGSVLFVREIDQDAGGMPGASEVSLADAIRAPMSSLLRKSAGAETTALRLRATSEADRAGEKLKVLLKVGQILSSPETIDRLLKKILDLVFEILDADRAAILVVDATGKLEPRAVKLRPGMARTDQIYSRNIVDNVRERGDAVRFNDARVDPQLGQAESILEQSICSSMCTPLKPKTQVIGVLYVDNLTVPNRFTDEDLDFLSAFAGQAAIAIENAQLYEQLEHEALKRANLLRFFPPTTAESILSAGAPALGAIETEVTALFCDISGFTAMSSTMEPGELVALLNEYLSAMAAVVFRHEGTLEKYIGDALMAVWGAPFRRADDAVRAIRAAVDMQHAMGALNERWGGRWCFDIHIGLNTGKVAAGNIGSEQFMQYATIGDATNLASRICDAAAAGEILLSESTVGRLGDVPWQLEEIGPVPVKGKAEPLRLVRLRWRPGESWVSKTSDLA